MPGRMWEEGVAEAKEKAGERVKARTEQKMFSLKSWVSIMVQEITT